MRISGTVLDLPNGLSLPLFTSSLKVKAKMTVCTNYARHPAFFSIPANWRQMLSPVSELRQEEFNTQRCLASQASFEVSFFTSSHVSVFIVTLSYGMMACLMRGSELCWLKASCQFLARYSMVSSRDYGG